MQPLIRKYGLLIAAFASLFLAVRYLLSLFLPFLLGSLLALAAEPVVQFLAGKLHIKRWIATGIGISMAFSFLILLTMMLCAFLLKELRQLTGILPELEGALRTGMNSASGWLLSLADRAPEGIRMLLTRNVNSFFSGSSALLDRASDYLLRLASGILSQVPNGALGFATGIISSFMISSKLPRIRQLLRQKAAHAQLQSALAVLKQLKATLGGWLKAQTKLLAVTFCLVLLGFLFLRIPHSLLWALLVALVDAFPILGTGTVLVPWSLISFLQGNRPLAFGLLGLYAAVTVIRSILEPKFLGKQLGLDPLITLVALYVGYRLWGIAGMILSPFLAVAATQLIMPQPDQSSP